MLVSLFVARRQGWYRERKGQKAQSKTRTVSMEQMSGADKDNLPPEEQLDEGVLPRGARR
jgi:hypothetical protein